MARKTPYIQTKQEIKIDKNFSDSLNTMINHIETIDNINLGKCVDAKLIKKYYVHLESTHKDIQQTKKSIFEKKQQMKIDIFEFKQRKKELSERKNKDIEKPKEENKKPLIKEEDKKIKFKEKDYESFKYITIRYNPNNSRYILEMSSELKSFSVIRTKIDKITKEEQIEKESIIDTSYQILYIKSEAYKNKKDTKFIEKKINGIENIKDIYLSQFLELIYEYDNNGENSFFDKSKDECIEIISQKIGSTFSAKKVYTMVRNKLNIVGKIEEYKEQTSNNKIDSIKNKVKDFQKEFDIQYKNTIEILNKRISDSKSRIKEFKEECSSNLIPIHNEQEVENKDMSNRFYFSFNGKLIDSWYEDGSSKYPMEEELVYQSLTDTQKELFDTEQKLITDRYEKIANEKIKRSIDMIYIIYDLLDEYFDIKLFEERELKDKDIKRTSTVIKKYYQYKIKNIKKFRHSYDRYIDDRKFRAKKVKEIEYLDRLIIENKDMLNNIFYFDRDIVEEDYKITPNSTNEELGYYHSEQIFSDELLDYLYQKYNKNIFLLKEKKSQINKIVSFYFFIMDGKIEEIDLFHNRDISAKNDKIYFKDKIQISEKEEEIDPFEYEGVIDNTESNDDSEMPF
jgi:hypothetical protein